MRNRYLFLFTFVLGVFVASPVFAQTTQVDALLEKLMEKGILTKAEVRSLKSEIVEDTNSIRQEQLKSELPE